MLVTRPLSDVEKNDFILIILTLKFHLLSFFFFFKDVESKYNQLCQRHSEQAATESEENKGTASFFNMFIIHT